MNWHKTEVKIENLPMLINQIKKSIQEGESILEKLRCVYEEDGDDILHLLTPFDFVDTFDENLKIKTFCMYQVLEN